MSDRTPRNAGRVNQGQQKLHDVFDSSGSKVNSPSGNEQWTQEEWRNRDKSLGYTRPDEDTEEPEEPEVP